MFQPLLPSPCTHTTLPQTHAQGLPSDVPPKALHFNTVPTACSGGGGGVVHNHPGNCLSNQRTWSKPACPRDTDELRRTTVM